LPPHAEARVLKGGGGGGGEGGGRRREEEKEGGGGVFKSALERHAHTPSGVAGADLKSQAGGALSLKDSDQEERV